MSRKCELNKCKTALTGNNVSHSNRKTKRKFAINLQNYSLMSEALGCFVKFRATPSSIRTVEYKNGLDNYLLNTKNNKLATRALNVKKRVLVALKKKDTAKASSDKSAEI